jgi:hypothetical protein
MTFMECIACWLWECAKFFFIFLGAMKTWEVLDAICCVLRDALLRIIRLHRRARRRAWTERRRRRQPITVR